MVCGPAWFRRYENADDERIEDLIDALFSACKDDHQEILLELSDQGWFIDDEDYESPKKLKDVIMLIIRTLQFQNGVASDLILDALRVVENYIK